MAKNYELEFLEIQKIGISRKKTRKLVIGTSKTIGRLKYHFIEVITVNVSMHWNCLLKVDYFPKDRNYYFISLMSRTS